MKDLNLTSEQLNLLESLTNDKYAGGKATELWREKINWQFENSRVISLDY